MSDPFHKLVDRIDDVKVKLSDQEYKQIIENVIIENVAELRKSRKEIYQLKLFIPKLEFPRNSHDSITMKLAHLVVDLALIRLSPERLTMIKEKVFPPFLLHMDSIPFEAILSDWDWREQEIPLSEHENEADQRDPIFVDNVVVISATLIGEAHP